MEVKVYNTDGSTSGTLTLNDEIFAVPWNADLVHQVIVSMRSNARTPIAHTKDRGDVSGGGKKPWRQKGTGRARHGSTRSPIWIGGGVAHGPRKEKRYDRKINRKMKASALFCVLSEKLRNNEILFVDDVRIDEPKTARAKEIIVNLSKIPGFEGLVTKKRNCALVSMGEYDVATAKSFANFGNILLDDVRQMNALDLLRYKYIILAQPQAAVSFIEAKR